ncbi:MAG: adenosylcobinamide amidohydrolase [Nitrospirales bacterium]
MSSNRPESFKAKARIVGRRTLVVDLGRPCRILSSAPRGGGFRTARYILNHEVSANPVGWRDGDRLRRLADPVRYLGRVADDLGIHAPCVALMTAVAMRHMVRVRESRDGLWVEVFCTLGLSNAVRAGEPVREPSVSFQRGAVTSRGGTINLILVTNAGLTSSAMVGAIQVATESKTATLLAERVRNWTGRAAATGTGTDATAIASGEGPRLRYSGTHTRIGQMIARAVARGVQRGLRRWRRWSRYEPR